MAVHVWQRWLGSLALALLACSPPDGAGARAPKNEGPRVATSDPPPGARWVGPIYGSDGADCALLERAGTEEGALAALRTAALARGIDFVKVTAVTKPYSDHICLHKRYRIDGVGYALPPPTPPTPPTPPPAPPPAPANARSCTPACAAGYVCRAGTCEAECDPACDRSQYCRFDRVCAPLPTAPPPPAGPEAAPLAPAPLPSP